MRTHAARVGVRVCRCMSSCAGYVLHLHTLRVKIQVCKVEPVYVYIFFMYNIYTMYLLIHEIHFFWSQFIG